MSTSNSYFLSFACADILDFGIIEFDTYGEAFDAYIRYEISGYSVVIRDIDMFGELAAEIRKGKTYEDRRGSSKQFVEGTICVLRTIGGQEQILRIDQTRYQEFVGCFSITKATADLITEIKNISGVTVL